MPSSWDKGNRPWRAGDGPRQDYRTNWRSDDRCFECREVGHHGRSCPNRQRTPPEASNERDPEETEPKSVDVRYIHGGTSAYLPLIVNGQSRMAVIDTGSQQSLVPASLVHARDIVGSPQLLRAVNGTDVKVLGQTNLHCQAADYMFDIPCLVAENVPEVILGLDWLLREHAQWNFGDHSIQILNHVLPLNIQRSSGKCRKITTEPNELVEDNVENESSSTSRRKRKRLTLTKQSSTVMDVRQPDMETGSKGIGCKLPRNRPVTRFPVVDEQMKPPQPPKPVRSSVPSVSCAGLKRSSALRLCSFDSSAHPETPSRPTRESCVSRSSQLGVTSAPRSVGVVGKGVGWSSKCR